VGWPFELTYLFFTVGDGGRSHCVASTLEWFESELLVAAVPTAFGNAVIRGSVVLPSPPLSSAVLHPPPPGGLGQWQSGPSARRGNGATYGTAAPTSKSLRNFHAGG